MIKTLLIPMEIDAPAQNKDPVCDLGTKQLCTGITLFFGWSPEMLIPFLYYSLFLYHLRRAYYQCICILC